MSSIQRRVIDTFSYKWDHAPDEASEERDRVATAWFYDRFGFDHKLFLLGDYGKFRDFLATKQTVLDAGCGLGNLTTHMAALAPHAEVWGIDASSAISHIPDIHGPHENMHLVECDLHDLDGLEKFPQSFDLIVSDGVLHHTPDTQTAFRALVRHMALGGDFLFYVYKKKAPVREFSDTFLRDITTKMNPDDCMRFSRQMAALGHQLREAKVTLTFDTPIPELGIPAGEMDLQRWFYWHFMKCFWDDGGNAVASVLENFDWYHPELAHRHTEEEVKGWVRDAGLEEIRCFTGDSGISMWCRRIP